MAAIFGVLNGRRRDLKGVLARMPTIVGHRFGMSGQIRDQNVDCGNSFIAISEHVQLGTFRYALTSELY